MARTLTVVALALALVAGACGDDDATETTTTTTATATTATDGDETTTTGGEMTTTTGDMATTGDSDLDALLATFAETPLRLTYEVGIGGDAQTIILSQDPTADPPVEAIELPDEGARIITSSDGMIICDPSGGCFQAPGSMGDLGGQGLTAGFLGPALGGYLGLAGSADTPAMDVETEQTTVAGRDGICYTFEPNQQLTPESDVERVRQCVDAELGFTLLIESQETGGEMENVMTLLEFEEPSPEDFEPTGEVQSVPQS